MERIVYEKWATNTEDLICHEAKWNVFVGKYDKVIGSKIIDIRFKKEEDDLNDTKEISSSCEFTIMLDNGSEIEIYLDWQGKVNIQTD